MSSASILAATFSCDIGEIREAQYQPGHTKQPIWAISDKYFAVSKARPQDDYDWKEHTDQFFAAPYGTKIWVATVEKE